MALSVSSATLVALAGFWKLVDLPTFADSLQSWSLVPNWARTVAVVIVPPTELLLGTLCLINLKQRWTYFAIAALVGCFTVVYALHVWFASPPDCACLGKIMLFKSRQSDAYSVVVRNTVLIGLLLAHPLYSVLQSKRKTPFNHNRSLSAECEYRGTDAPTAFTLVELLVSIAIIGSVLLILMPSLYSARESARRMQRQSGLRQAVISFHSYAMDFDDMWPQYTLLPPANTVVRVHGEALELPYFHAYSAWHIILADYLFDGNWDSPALTPRSAHSDPIVTDYWYSASLRAYPDFWNAETRVGPSQWGPTRTSDVTFPSKKVILRDVGPTTYLGGVRYQLVDGLYAGLADGSAVRVAQDKAVKPYPHGEGTWPGSKFAVGLWGMHTVDGVRGLDLR